MLIFSFWVFEGVGENDIFYQFVGLKIFQVSKADGNETFFSFKHFKITNIKTGYR